MQLRRDHFGSSRGLLRPSVTQRWITSGSNRFCRVLLQGPSLHFHVELVDSAEDDVGLSEPSTESAKVVWTISQEYITELIVGMLSNKPVKVHRNVSQDRTLQKPVDQIVDMPVLQLQEECVRRSRFWTSPFSGARNNEGINGPSSNKSRCRNCRSALPNKSLMSQCWSKAWKLCLLYHSSSGNRWQAPQKDLGSVFDSQVRLFF